MITTLRISNPLIILFPLSQIQNPNLLYNPPQSFNDKNRKHGHCKPHPHGNICTAWNGSAPKSRVGWVGYLPWDFGGYRSMACGCGTDFVEFESPLPLSFDLSLMAFWLLGVPFTAVLLGCLTDWTPTPPPKLIPPNWEEKKKPNKWTAEKSAGRKKAWPQFRLSFRVWIRLTDLPACKWLTLTQPI